ncbi:MAG: hypothetical protein U9Q77_13125, partial [Candidatus Marinimicrobia bacterium]|nr:hypothetical protein [Candidatus Neomarinimicrobiota bacterium]
MKKRYLFILVLLPVVFLFTNCEEDDPEEVIEPPMITSLSSTDAYTGEPVTITGENFNPVLNMNLVELAGKTVTVSESVTPSEGSETNLTFFVPGMSTSGATIDAYVSVRNLGNDLTSDSLEMIVKPIFDVDSVPALPKTKGGIAFDGEDKLYVRGQDPGEVYIIGPNGNQRYFGQTHWGEGEMVVGPDGYLYAAVVWGTYGVTRISLATEGDYETYIPDTDIDNPFCLDFDEDENLYVGTADGGFWRRNSDASVTQILSNQGWGAPTRINDGYVYWYTRSDSGRNGLYRAMLPDAATQDTITDASIETILLTEDYSPSGLAVDSFGNVYLAVGWGNKMLTRITPAGIAEELMELPTENPNKFTFHGDVLYITQGNQGNQIWTYYL